MHPIQLGVVFGKTRQYKSSIVQFNAVCIAMDREDLKLQDFMSVHLSRVEQVRQIWLERLNVIKLHGSAERLLKITQAAQQRVPHFNDETPKWVIAALTPELLPLSPIEDTPGTLVVPDDTEWILFEQFGKFNGKLGFNCAFPHLEQLGPFQSAMLHYSFVLSPNKQQAYIHVPGKKPKLLSILKNGTYMFEGIKQTLKPVKPLSRMEMVKPRHVIRLVTRNLPLLKKGAIIVQFERNQKSVIFRAARDRMDIRVHFQQLFLNLGVTRSSIRKALRNIVRQLHKSRIEARDQRRLAKQFTKIYVGMGHSSIAGNCTGGTIYVTEQAMEAIGAVGPCSFRGDIVWALNNEDYQDEIRRATRQASEMRGASLFQIEQVLAHDIACWYYAGVQGYAKSLSLRDLCALLFPYPQIEKYSHLQQPPSSPVVSATTGTATATLTIGGVIYETL